MENFENIPTPVNPIAPQMPPNNFEEARPQNKKRVLALIAGFVVMLALAFVVGFAIFERMNGEKTATTEGKLLATVGVREIFDTDVKKIALEQYKEEKLIDEKVIPTFLDIAIERAILELEAEKLSIQVTPQQISNRKGTIASPKSDEEIKYDIIKENIMLKNVKNVTAFTVGFWIASFDYEQKPEYATQRAEGKLALADIEQRLRNNEVPAVIAKQIQDKYPELKDIVAINGYIFSNTNDINLISRPRIYTLDPKEIGKDYNDSEMQTAMSKMRAGDIIKVERSDGSGGNVVKAVAINQQGFVSYEEFIDTRYKELVKIEK